jgi:hypothetical protein
MDLNRLYRDLTEQKFTDLKLILVDPKDKVEMVLHKNILVASSKYFDSLLTFGKEAKQSEIKVEVMDANVAHDVVLSFFGQKMNSTKHPDWLYILRMFKIRNFFLLPNDTNVLYDLVVPKEGFGELMGILENLDLNDEKLVQMIRRNIPVDYPAENFTMEFQR